jgi:pantetheine-phosphate adenylyltransferase
MERIALFPGSFDPFTLGHADVVKRALPLFDHIIVGLGINSNKVRSFSPDYMLNRIAVAFADEPKVSVEQFSGLTATFALEKNARFLLRGLRNTTDFEYENTLAQANAYINQGLETVFLITSPPLAFISSTIVRDLYRHNADVSPFLPYPLV